MPASDESIALPPGRLNIQRSEIVECVQCCRRGERPKASDVRVRQEGLELSKPERATDSLNAYFCLNNLDYPRVRTDYNRINF